MFARERAAITVRLAKLAPKSGRLIIAVAGPPAAGKSTLAELLVEDLNGPGQSKAVLVPMDGFHLDNSALDAMGLRHRKGAPQTFDAEGFAALVRQIADRETDIFYPTFDRTQDKTIANSASVSTDTDIVVVEGNYLLLKEQPWASLEPFFDLTIFVKPDVDLLQARLIERWRHYGFEEDAALEKAMGNDIPNAIYVLENSSRADMEFAADS